MTDYQTENDELMDAFLQRTFYNSWKNPEIERLLNFRTVEFMLNYRCNLSCKYCYVNRYGEQLYPSHSYADEDKLLKNLEMYLDWMVKNEYQPNMELFSGEALVQRVGHKALHMIFDKMGNRGLKTRITVPTNFTFILSDTLTEKVEELIGKSRDVGVPMGLSASFDGKYCESNRPFLHDVASSKQDDRTIWHWEYKGIPDRRDDEYYDKCFAFAKKWAFGFHPMVYSENIEHWQKNFLWFQDKFMEFDIPFWNLYLLEVRNPEWSVKQCNHLRDFMKFLVKWSWEGPARKNIDKYFQFVFEMRGFNILSGPLSQTGRGMGCSFQSGLYLRVGDLALVPCHRTSYEQNTLARYTVDNGKISGLKAINPELMIGGIQANAECWPYCEQCLLRDMCSKGCQGAQLETTGDLYTPFPTMCRMEHAKMIGQIEGYKEIGILDAVIHKVNEKKARALTILNNMLEGENIWKDLI